MIPAALRAVFSAAGPVAFRAALNGRVYATQWSEWKGEVTEGVYCFVSTLELDPVALGQGGSILYVESELHLDGALRPLRYVSRARGSALVVLWTQDDIVVTMADLSTQRLPHGDARYVVESHFSGLEALALAHLFQSGQLAAPARTSLFFVNQLAVIPYQLSPAPELGTDGGTWYRSSFHEEIKLDAQGQLLLLRTPMQGIEVVRLPEAPPLPERSQMSGGFQPARYTPPADAHFRLEDVTIPGPVTPIGGTLTIPQGEPGQRFAAVLFIAGSGAHDRHGITGELDSGTHEIVDALAEAGFVGLRYDTRGAGSTQLGADALDLGLKAIIDDARAAYAFLRARPEVDPQRLFLIGHSQGGSVALAMLTRLGESAAGVALLATVGRTMAEVSLDQLAAQAKQTSSSEAQLQKQVALTQEFYELLRSNKEWRAGEIPDVHMPAQRMVPWLREWLSYPSDEMIPELRCPLFIANGDKDFQVDAEKDAERMYATARRAGIAVTLRRYPLLDHLFKATRGDSSLASYYDPSRHVDPQFLSDLAAWLKSVAQSKVAT